MGYFDRVEQDVFDKYREQVRGELLAIQQKVLLLQESTEVKLNALNDYVKQSATVSDETARSAAESAVASKKNIADIEVSFKEILEEINSLKASAGDEFNIVSRLNSDAKHQQEELESILTSARLNHAELAEKRLEIDNTSEIIAEKVDEFNEYLERSSHLPNSLEETNNILAKCKKSFDSIQNLLDHSVKRKAEIDGLYKEIYGEDISDSEGEVEHAAGLKDELKSAYTELSKNISNLDNQVKKSIGDSRIEFKRSLDEKLSEFQNFLDASTSRFAAVDAQLTGLLPGAMAAGLSAAYEEKKTEEINSLKSFNKVFGWAIFGMVLISSIPLGIDVYLLIWKSLDLVKILKDTPTLILAILPLYFPVLWLAYSSNRKANLSKRLIEEYTHKSVLGKTFSGLSNQIETLQHQGVVKEELRTKLLFNVLQVSAENPGKLITNYSKSDHPLMDALENSVKLADSIAALSKIPGFSAIANKLAEKTDDLLKENTKKVSDGLQVQEMLEANGKETEEK